MATKDREVGAEESDAGDLMIRVRNRLGPERRGASCMITTDVYAGNGAGKSEVRWRRVYADGVCSDEHWGEGTTVEECLRLVLEYEDDADLLQPEYAGPPPA